MKFVVNEPRIFTIAILTITYLFFIFKGQKIKSAYHIHYRKGSGGPWLYLLKVYELILYRPCETYKAVNQFNLTFLHKNL